jgi:hypothetical protein
MSNGKINFDKLNYISDFVLFWYVIFDYFNSFEYILVISVRG